MKSFRSTLFFFFFTVALIGSVYVFVYKAEQDEQKKSEADAVLIQLPVENVVKFEIQTRSNSSIYEKKDSNWHIRAPLIDEADTGVTGAFLANLLAEKAEEVVEEGEKIQWDRYGLDKPIGKFVFTTTEGKQSVLQVGSKSFDSSLYARRDSDNKVLLISGSWDSHLAKAPRELRNKKLYRKGNGEEVESLEISRSGAPSVLLMREKEIWKVEGTQKTKVPIAKENIEKYLTLVRNLRVQDFIGEDKADTVVTKTLKLDRPYLTIRLKRKNLQDLKLEFSKPEDTVKVAIGKNENSSTSKDPFVLSTDVQAITRVARADYDQLNKGIEEFYDRRVPFAFQLAEVEQVSLRTPHVAIDAQKKGGEWVAIEPNATKQLDSAKLAEFLSKLKELEAGQYLGVVPAKGVKLNENEVVLKNKTGESVFKFSWGSPLSGEKSAADPSAQSMLYAKSNRIDQTFAIEAQAIERLSFAELLKAETPKVDVKKE